MSDLYVLYVTATGNPVSIGSTPTALAPAELATKGWTQVVISSPTFEQFQADYVWDAATRTPQLRPVPVSIVVSANLQTKLANRLTNNTDTVIPNLDATDLALDTIRAAPITNTAEARTQIRALAQVCEDLTRALRRTIVTDNTLIRLLLGDAYGKQDEFLATEAGTD